MTLINITGKMNRKNSRINIGSFSAKILGGLAITALTAAAAVSPLSARPMSADEPATPLVREAGISYDQLIDDLGEWGRFSNSKVTAASADAGRYDQLIDDLCEWGR